MTPRQTNLTPRLTTSLLTDHMTFFYERPMMETYRCRREEEQEEGVTILEKIKAIYRGGRVKNVWEAIITIKKRVNDGSTYFLTLPPSKNV